MDRKYNQSESIDQRGVAKPEVFSGMLVRVFVFTNKKRSYNADPSG